MSAQILHEAEHTRQHARYNIPVKVIIDGKTYDVQNWSVNGLAIINAPISLGQKRRFEAELLFDFQKIKSTINVDLERKDYDIDDAVFRAGFVNLDKDKLSFMHHIINSYLSGELVSGGSVINILQNSRYTQNDPSKKVEKRMNLGSRIWHRLKQLFIYLFLTAIVLGLLSFIAYKIYNKFYIVKSTDSVISAKTIVIRAPAPGYYIPTDVIQNSKISIGNLLASMKLVSGGASSIESPTSGKIIEKHVLSNEFVDKAEPLLTILPTGAKPYIETKIPSKQAVKLNVGDLATIELSNKKQIKAAIKSIKNIYIPNSPMPNLVNIILEPKTDLNIDQIGNIVTVTIDTFELKEN